MEILDPGHKYKVDSFDGELYQIITFMKRVGEGYPFNEPPTYSGTNCQEVLRVLINRVEHLHKQEPCKENDLILDCFKTAYWLFEKRAAKRHGKDFPYSIFHPDDLYNYPTGLDGHVLIDNPIFQALISEATIGSKPWEWDNV